MPADATHSYSWVGLEKNYKTLSGFVIEIRIQTIFVEELALVTPSACVNI